MADDLVVRRIAEPHELHLRDRSHPGHSQTEGCSDDPGLRDRRVDDPLVAVALTQPVGHPEDPAGPAHILTEEDHAGIGGERVV